MTNGELVIDSRTGNWPNSPIVTYRRIHIQTGERRGTRTASAIWSQPMVCVMPYGDIEGRVSISIKYDDDWGNSGAIRYKVEIVNLENQVTEEVASVWSTEPVVITNDTCLLVNDNDTIDIDIPIQGQWTRFKISLQMLDSRQSIGDYNQFKNIWMTNQDGTLLIHENYYTIYSRYFGDFSLDYLPVTILYCPPFQDMTNSLFQSNQFATNFSIGSTEAISSETGVEQRFSGGIKLRMGFQGSQSYDQTSGTDLQSSFRNTVGVVFEWNTLLTADNRRAIGRAYWGALGDLFVILKNPWFSVRQDHDQNGILTLSGNNPPPELLVIPTHKLLRPDGDPIAERIPKPTRHRLLELDPFITNLDDFFPEDKGLDLSLAVDQYKNPSLSQSSSSFPYLSSGDNRAALLGRYSLCPGVVLDISRSERIVFEDTTSNQTTYFSKITNTKGFSGQETIGIPTELGLFEIGMSQYEGESSSQLIRITYHSSCETSFGTIRTASCSLIRNQNESDICDIELWYDKNFSTFMFRKIDPTLFVVGVIEDPFGDTWRNILVRFLNLETDEIFTTTTDENGRFSICNIRNPGVYKIQCGNQEKTIKITKEDLDNQRIIAINLKNVKRILHLKNSPLWVLKDILKIGSERANTIRNYLINQKVLNSEVFEQILMKNKFSLKKLSERALVIYEDERDEKQGENTLIKAKREKIE